MTKNELFKLYVTDKKSMYEIANIFAFSLHKVSYWMHRFKIPVRSRSEATYVKRNPVGDPFHFRFPKNKYEERLFGIGVGLYWGEGTKADKNSVRLGNTDPKLIAIFIEFLTTFFQIKKADLRFGLQIFSDIDPQDALDFWRGKLKLKDSQFLKTIVTRSGSVGTYRKKSEFGVLQVMYHNKKMRDVLNKILADVAQW